MTRVDGHKLLFPGTLIKATQKLGGVFPVGSYRADAQRGDIYLGTAKISIKKFFGRVFCDSIRSQRAGFGIR